MTEPSEHRVATHLGVDARTYDASIRRFIPGYEAMIGVVLSILDEHLGPQPVVVDLGAGTGALGAAILEAIPRSRVVLVDIDPSMLAVAQERVARYADRVELRTASFYDERALPSCDAVVACLALHHVPDLDRKRGLYASIHRALRPGGVLLNADVTVHETGLERARSFREWAAGMAAHGIGADEADALFARWGGEDRYFSLAAELGLLATAGFPRPDCFWKQAASTVFGGFR